MNKIFKYLLFVILTFILFQCNSILSYNTQMKTNQNNNLNIGIVRYPEASYSQSLIYKNFDQLPRNKSSLMSLRNTDLSMFNLKTYNSALLNAEFDSLTIWPKELPTGFNPNSIMNNGKNPGLSINKLHEAGINGNGVGIAVIDLPPLVNHNEYKENIVFYEEIHIAQETASMHGTATASIAVGKTVGVAPGSNLYFIGVNLEDKTLYGKSINYIYLAQAIERIIQINNGLPSWRKIRVISVSIGLIESRSGFKRLMDVIQNANNHGIFVITTSLEKQYKILLMGLDRAPLSDPNTISSYKPGIFWSNAFYTQEDWINNYPKILTPMDSRTVASSTGENDYYFCRNGGLSFTVPYLSGLYALACQVNPQITPEYFLKKILETGNSIDIEYENNNLNLSTIINPFMLINNISTENN
ncbi:MAG: S8/S53 family peptidase [Ruminiclostridium sp.]|nr:S8/S53 family peptidase [Ruminiclostridium sp.]